MRHRIVESFRITPENTPLEALSPSEIDALFAESKAELHGLLRRCALAVLASGEETDDVKTMLERNARFDIEVLRTAGGIEIVLKNAPFHAFVTYAPHPGRGGGTVYKIIEGLRQNVFAVLRDLVFVKAEIERTGKFDLESSAGITDAVFLILRNAGIFNKLGRHKIIVCWGGHAISSKEYEYTKQVGYQCGLRFMDVITGCGPGAMKGPMKGAAIAHSKQRVIDGRYIGITEPGIIASEAPNAIVNPLVILPDIEKRLEAFVRLGHGVVIFPGGAGTAEELMYVLGLLSHPRNADVELPLLLTGPRSAEPYFSDLDRFVRDTLGDRAADRYEIVIDDPVRVAERMNARLLEVKLARERSGDSYYFNRSLFVPEVFQRPFTPSHDDVSALTVRREDAPHRYAAALRRVFSAVVWGNVKPDGIAAVEARGPLSIRGDAEVLAAVDTLVEAFAAQRRMRLSGDYAPVYEITP